jgi:hypothetical protein
MDGIQKPAFDPTPAFERLIEVLTNLGIPYIVGGSLASSIHGIGRATSDIDLVAQLRVGQIEAFTDALRPDFYADADMIKDSLILGRSFNLIHFSTTHKFDIFPGTSEFERLQIKRGELVQSSPFGMGRVMFKLASPEDTILAKLAWFKRGGCVSERQWTDVIGVVRVQAGQLDLTYLREWGPRLGVADLLEEALEEGATRPGAGPHRPEKPSI